MTIQNKPTIHKAPTIYKLGGGGGGGGGDTVEIGGKIYPIVRIGDQEWLGENLALEIEGFAINPSGYKSTPAIYYNLICKYVYGYFYNWYAADYINQHELIPGWRVPNRSDWETLVGYVGGYNAFSSKCYDKEWLNTSSDEFKFRVLPSGNYANPIAEQGIQLNSGNAYFLTTTDYDSNTKEYYFRCMRDITPAFVGATKGAARSIRLIKST